MPKFLPIILMMFVAAFFLVACQENNQQAGEEASTAGAGVAGESTGDTGIQDQESTSGKEAPSSSNPAGEMTWRPYEDPGMDLEQIKSLSREEALAKLEELEVPFEPVRFHESIEMDPVELTALFLQAGMPVDTPNHAGVSPLQAAAFKQKKKHLQLLLDNGADVDYKDPHFQATVTDFAVGSGNVEILKMLLEAGADPAGGPDSRPILIDAIESRNLEMFQFVYERYPDIEVTDASGQGTLINACLVGSTEIARELIEAGADVKVTEPQGGTPISAAAFRGNWDLVDYLISQGADPTASYRGNRNLFFEMAGSQQWPAELAEQLLEQDVDINQAEERSHSTPLIQAARKGNNSFARFLLEKGVDTSAVDKDGFDAYDYAELTQNGELIALFTRYGVMKVDKGDSAGEPVGESGRD